MFEKSIKKIRFVHSRHAGYPLQWTLTKRSGYWSPQDPTKDMPTGIVGVAFGSEDRKRMPNPALLDPLDATVYDIAAFDALPLTDYPLVIADKRVYSVISYRDNLACGRGSTKRVV